MGKEVQCATFCQSPWTDNPAVVTTDITAQDNGTISLMGGNMLLGPLTSLLGIEHLPMNVARYGEMVNDQLVQLKWG